jgi:hypothetical protein
MKFSRFARQASICEASVKRSHAACAERTLAADRAMAKVDRHFPKDIQSRARAN